MTPRRAASVLCPLVLVGILAVPGPALAQDLPKLTAPVTDLARVIDPASAAELDRRIRLLQKASGDAVVVLTVPTFAPYGSIEEYAVKVFEQSGPGGRANDNGALIVLAVSERRVRIEVGYGLEEFVPDGFAGDTIRQAMLPAFREAQYGAGLLAGASRIIQRIADRRNITLADLPAEAPVEREGPSLVQILIIAIVLIAIISSLRRGGGGPNLRRRGGWPTQPWGGGWYGGLGGFGGGFGGHGRSGGGFGGFGGFGGGRSGGGGASGGW